MGLILALLLAQVPDPGGPIYSSPALMTPRVPAAFEFLPADGGGATGICACSNATQPDGGAVSFARNNAAFCSKQGNATTGLTVDSLVLCAADQMRIEPFEDGGIALRVEHGGLNFMGRTSEFDNALWKKSAVGGATTPTVTADYAVAPDGTTTADLLCWGDTDGGAQRSAIWQTNNSAAGTTGSVYMRSPDGGVSFATLFVTGNSGQYTTCLADAGWSRCAWTVGGGGTNGLAIGCYGPDMTGGAPCPGGCIVAWNGQLETNATSSGASSPISASSAAAQRGVDLATMSHNSEVGPQFCMAADFAPIRTAGLSSVLVLNTVASSATRARFTHSSDTAIVSSLGTSSSAPTVSAMGTGAHRYYLSDNGSGTRTLKLDNSSLTAPSSSMTPMSPTTLRFVVQDTNDAGMGLIGRVQFFSDSTRCAP